MRTGKFYVYTYIYFVKLAFVLFLFVLLLQYLNFFGTKITENVPDCNVYYVLFWYPDKTYVRDFSEVYKFSYKRGLRSWRFCCVSQSKSYSRAKAESRTKMKTMGEGAREKTRSAFARLNLETCCKSTSHTAHKFLKVNEASLLA